MRVALTFDAELPGREHHSPAAPGRILDVLADTDTRATFFVQGRWANAEPTLARRIADNGHLIGSHGHHHVPMTWLLGGYFTAEVADADAAIQDRCGVYPESWFRCPFGAVDRRVLGQLGQLGKVHVGWDLQVADWEPETTAQAIVEGIVDRVQDGSVVLLHTWPSTTALAIWAVVHVLKSEGVEFVTVDALERIPEGCP